MKKTFNRGTVTEKRALTGVDLTLADGDFVTVIGGNGAGKSTLLNMIAGVYPLDSGTIELERALTGVDLTLADGDFVTVIGGNGAGKSTLLNMIAGVYPLDSGTIELDGEDISRLSEPKRAKYLGRVFQDPMRGSAADMQIEENLALAKRRGQRRGLRWGITKDERAEYADVRAQARQVPGPRVPRSHARQRC